MALFEFKRADTDSDWPQWRGKNRDGVAIGAKLPAMLPARLERPQWSVTVGEGYAPPAVVQGKVVVLGRDERGKEHAYALDNANGKVLWDVAWASDFVPPDPTAGKGPNSAPTVDRDRVYTLGLGGMFHCLDLRSGRVLWKHDFRAEFWSAEKDKNGDNPDFPVCGTAASPIVEGDRVIVPVGGAKTGAFAAFHRQTGEVVWKALSERSSYGSPMIADIAGIRQVIGFTGLRMVGLRLSDAKLLWEFPFRAGYEQTMLTPVLWKDKVIIGGEGRPTVALTLTRAGDGITTEKAWQNPDLRTYITTPVVVKDRLYGLSTMSRSLVCVEMATGKTIWTSPRFAEYGSLIAAGDRLLALSTEGSLVVFRAGTPEYTPEVTWDLGEPRRSWSLPVVVGNSLYLRNGPLLNRYEL